MDKAGFINKIREAEKSRPDAKLPQFTKDDTTSFPAVDGSPKDAFVRNFLANHGNVMESGQILVDRSNPEVYDFGISRASMAIAESGAIVLKDRDTADRLATIAPWIHVAVVKESDIVPTISDALEKTVDCPYAIYVAGPSKTTDVEGVLVEGVHGPGCQVCLIVK